MKTFIAVTIIFVFYAVTLAGIHAIAGLFFSALYALFGLPFSTIFISDALQNYSFFDEA